MYPDFRPAERSPHTGWPVVPGAADPASVYRYPDAHYPGDEPNSTRPPVYSDTGANFSPPPHAGNEPAPEEPTAPEPTEETIPEDSEPAEQDSQLPENISAAISARIGATAAKELAERVKDNIGVELTASQIAVAAKILNPGNLRDTEETVVQTDAGPVIVEEEQRTLPAHVKERTSAWEPGEARAALQKTVAALAEHGIAAEDVLASRQAILDALPALLDAGTPLSALPELLGKAPSTVSNYASVAMDLLLEAAPPSLLPELPKPATVVKVPMNLVGAEINQLRAQAGIQRAELAAQVGVSLSVINRLMSDDAPRNDQLFNTVLDVIGATEEQKAALHTRYAEQMRLADMPVSEAVEILADKGIAVDEAILPDKKLRDLLPHVSEPGTVMLQVAGQLGVSEATVRRGARAIVKHLIPHIDQQTDDDQADAESAAALPPTPAEVQKALIALDTNPASLAHIDSWSRSSLRILADTTQSDVKKARALGIPVTDLGRYGAEVVNQIQQDAPDVKEVITALRTAANRPNFSQARIAELAVRLSEQEVSLERMLPKQPQVSSEVDALLINPALSNAMIAQLTGIAELRVTAIRRQLVSQLEATAEKVMPATGTYQWPRNGNSELTWSQQAADIIETVRSFNTVSHRDISQQTGLTINEITAVLQGDPGASVGDVALVARAVGLDESQTRQVVIRYAGESVPPPITDMVQYLEARGVPSTDALSENENTMLRMLVSDVSIDDIAAYLQISTMAARAMHTRISNKLRDLMEGGVES
ncbi:MAG TPA: helix-turn-helix transcriptional regulator [Candidatus Saccharimonadales bacterium]|nr:helix-turn-helix transcriptional regulator [Candidatus Saccharimonadales bacterium]